MSTPDTECPACRRPYVEIRLPHEIGDVLLRSCSTCDYRTWTAEGDHVDVDAVLDGLKVKRRRKPGEVRAAS